MNTLLLLIADAVVASAVLAMMGRYVRAQFDQLKALGRGERRQK